MALDLSGKIGGIPVPVIGGVLGLALVGVLYFRSSSKAAASDAPSLVAVPDVGPGDQIDSTGQDGGGVASSVPMFGSNGTWTASAVAWEIATNGSSPLDVQAAISNYLEGSDLTFKQSEIINRILSKFGLPPQGVTGISTIIPKQLPFKDPVVETPIPTGQTTGNAGTANPSPVSNTPTYTRETYDPSTGYTVTNLSDGTNLISDQNKTYAAGTYMAGGNLYNADGTPANDQARAVQARINAMFGR